MLSGVWEADRSIWAHPCRSSGLMESHCVLSHVSALFRCADFAAHPASISMMMDCLFDSEYQIEIHFRTHLISCILCDMLTSGHAADWPLWTWGSQTPRLSAPGLSVLATACPGSCLSIRSLERAYRFNKAHGDSFLGAGGLPPSRRALLFVSCGSDRHVPVQCPRIADLYSAICT